MIRKFIAVLGILGALIAIEGLLRFGSLVGMLGATSGEVNDHAFYTAFSIVSFGIAGFLLVSLFRSFSGNKVRVLKYIFFMLGLFSLGLMMVAPNLPVVGQIIGGMAFSQCALLLVKIEKGTVIGELGEPSPAAPNLHTYEELPPVPKKSSRLVRLVQSMSALAASGFIFIFVTGGEEEGGRVSLGEAATTLATDVLTSSDGYSPTFEVGEVLSIEPFLIRIDRVRTAKSIGSEYWSTRANGEAVYLVVEYSFKNDGAQQLSAYNAPDIIIRDADQNWLAPSPSPAEVMKANILASEFSQQTFYNGDPINPGITYQDVVVFEIDEDRLGEAGWRLVPNYNDREVLVRFMNEPSSNFERPEYLNPVSSETHSAVEVAELGAMLHVDTIFLGGNCCEATLIGGIALTQAFSCPRNVEGELYEYEVEICGQNCGTDTFAICVPSTFDSIADLILVNDEYGHIEARSLSIKLEKLYVYRAG